MIHAAILAFLLAAPAAAQVAAEFPGAVPPPARRDALQPPGATAPPARPVGAPLRPWCGVRGLNATERAICTDPVLVGLDARLAGLYGRSDARLGDAAQQDWLREGRDACGADVACILGAYLNRITELEATVR